MQLPGIGSGDSGFSSGNPFASQELGKDAFMRLLVTQLKNQDPLEPMSNESFIAQLASFSSLEELEELNGNIIAMIALNQSNAILSQLTQSSALIGKEVRWIDLETGAEQVGLVESVKLEDGIGFLSIDGENIPLAAVTEILGAAGDGSSGGSDGMSEEEGDGSADS